MLPFSGLAQNGDGFRGPMVPLRVIDFSESKFPCKPRAFSLTDGSNPVESESFSASFQLLTPLGASLDPFAQDRGERPSWISIHAPTRAFVEATDGWLGR